MRQRRYESGQGPGAKRGRCVPAGAALSMASPRPVHTGSEECSQLRRQTSRAGDYLIRVGNIVRDSEGTRFKVLFFYEGRIFMQKLGTDPDVFYTRNITWEQFEKYGYSIVEE